jgi:hypothetical protein
VCRRARRELHERDVESSRELRAVSRRLLGLACSGRWLTPRMRRKRRTWLACRRPRQRVGSESVSHDDDYDDADLSRFADVGRGKREEYVGLSGNLDALTRLLARVVTEGGGKELPAWRS